MFSVSCSCFMSLHHRTDGKSSSPLAESCNGVVLEGLDGPLCCIGAVVMWFDKLHLDDFFFKVLFCCFCCNIINDVEHWFEVSLF